MAKDTINPQDQEDYIWAMRLNAVKDTTSHPDFEQSKRASSIFSSITITPGKPNIDDLNLARMTLMATLVPDEVIHNHNNYASRDIDACFLFGDVSGFTDLCEKYSKTGISGPSRMTQVLNKYLGAMVQEILAFGGDVLKFSGDAFLAMFKPNEDVTMRDIVHQAIDCALIIQKNYGSYETDVGVVIRVKLAISSGPCVFSLIGNEINSHYVVVGKPIWDVKTAESISSAGDIIVAPPAWAYVNSSEYEYQDMPDRIHVRIVGVGPHWASVQKTANDHARKRSSFEEASKGQHSDSSSSSSASDSSDEILADADEEFTLRPSVNFARREDIVRALPRFIIAPVMKSIDQNEPFEYLTEMRQSVIVFINVVWTKLTSKEMVVLVDNTYKIVCGVVNKVKGCVNKVSLFDKDLMLVVVFGLRGLKHELECQLALRSARKCLLKINSLEGVISTSIGVTTGITYCGVFGHSLRREYTVISLIVNKAARLMVNYKNQVTCDMETFLHSKMESSNFILQPYKPLKGISHPGPVYEFKEVENYHLIEHSLNEYPILGRDDHLKLYLQLLDQCFTDTSDKRAKMLLIEADARQGKTRLLDEVSYNMTPQDNIKVNSLHLSLSDRKIPYQAIKLLLAYPLKLPKVLNAKESQKKILEVVKTPENVRMICSLNKVFETRFKGSKEYAGMDDEKKSEVLTNILMEICRGCFTSKWVITIDNLQFTDEKSLEFLNLFLDLDMVFIVATIGRDTIIPSKPLERFFLDSRIHVCELEPIDKWYLGALACHFMDVAAIPAELEKTIQARSNGNCGWIESYLIGMLQDDGLQILQANLRQINDLGLVSPPLYMMTRMAQSETTEWKHIMEERRLTISPVEEDNWEKYIDSCRDSYINITVRGNLFGSRTSYEENMFSVCVLSPNFHIINVSSELSSDSMVMKTFDSLNSYEQLLIKCSATLGSPFTRDMLVYVMNALDSFRTALAVKKLFEIKVICCAKGDFIEGQNLVFKERLINPKDIRDVNCRCRGVTPEDICKFLPTYASCGYMQFRSKLFREITYNLLTDNQKKEFHTRAIRYLEKETRRCKACGNGYFEKLLGYRYNRELLNQVKKRKITDIEIISEDQISVTSSGRRPSSYSTGTSVSSHSLHRGKGTYARTNADRLSVGSFMSFSGSIRARSNYSFQFGFTMIQKLKHSYSLTRVFSSEDFTECQCNLILCTAYARLLEHCSGAGNLEKLVETMMQYSKIAINCSNLPLAMQLLNESLKVLEQLQPATVVNKWKLTMHRGRIFHLIGLSYLKMHQVDQAMVYLIKSLAEYNLKIPGNLFQTKLKTFGCRFKQDLGLFIFPRILLKKCNHWDNVFTNSLSECLRHLSVLYQKKKKWTQAFLLASWSLNNALASFTDYRVICLAYANMITIADHLRKMRLCIALEVHALKFVHMKVQVDIDELQAVAVLYGAIYYSRVRQGYMDKAIHIGFIVLRLSTIVNAVQDIVPLLPLILQCLMMVNYTSSIISLLQELDCIKDQEFDTSGQIWYLALCMGLLLETGYTALTYDDCERFYHIEGDKWTKLVKDESAVKRYFTVMWLWCVRNEKWEAASLWWFHQETFVVYPTKNDTFIDRITSLYLFEGLLLSLVYKMDKHCNEASMQLKKQIDWFIQCYEKNSYATRIIQPRFYHLKAYYKLINNDGKFVDILSKARHLAKDMGNTLETLWSEHSFKAWNEGLSAETMTAWKERCETDNALDYREMELNGGKYQFFTLPQPIFC